MPERSPALLNVCLHGEAGFGDSRAMLRLALQHSRLGRSAQQVNLGRCYLDPHSSAGFNTWTFFGHPPF